MGLFYHLIIPQKEGRTFHPIHTDDSTPLTSFLLTLRYMPDYLQCTVLEVKNIEGLGTTIDVIIVNGALSEGDRIVVCTMDGPVVTSIRALLTPPPNRELRIKSDYIHHKHLNGAIGAKICASGIEKVIAGTSVMLIGPEDDEGDIQDEVMKDFNKIAKMNLQPRGVTVQVR